MKTKNDSRLARVLKILLDLLFGLAVFAGIGLLIWSAISPMVLKSGEGLGSASVPVRIGTGEEPQFQVSFIEPLPAGIIGASVHEAEGMLFVETESSSLIAIANAPKILIVFGLAYIFNLLRKIVSAIEAGEPFTLDTSHRVRQLGYAVLALSFLGSIVEYLAAREIFNRLPTIVPELAPGPTFDARILFVALMILLLAHIWSYGLDLERERALTV
jgi:hypothetical protein